MVVIRILFVMKIIINRWEDILPYFVSRFNEVMFRDIHFC